MTKPWYPELDYDTAKQDQLELKFLIHVSNQTNEEEFQSSHYDTGQILRFAAMQALPITARQMCRLRSSPYWQSGRKLNVPISLGSIVRPCSALEMLDHVSLRARLTSSSFPLYHSISTFSRSTSSLESDRLRLPLGFVGCCI